jgi:UDP-2,4-diacetamido-2,4,6-trideoxy-beta-L-altropyranose hydrolase
MTARRAGPVLGVVADHGGVGVGHLGRSLAVAQAWGTRGGEALFLTDEALPAGWPERIAAASATVDAWERLGDPGVDAWLVDGYRFPTTLHTQLRRGAPVAVVDDHASLGRYDADLVVDHNLGASEADYEPIAPGARLLLGPSYALLRQELVGALGAAPRDRTAPPSSLLVALGGEPTDELLGLVEPALDEARSRGLQVDRLAGMVDVSSALARADVAVSAAGTTALELCAFGVPAVLVAAVPNQHRGARRYGQAGVALDAGDLGVTTGAAVRSALVTLLDEPERRHHQSTIGRQLVDGRGADRLVDAIRELLDP